ncbi:MAG: glycosyltransferase family 1 protein [Methylovirgula sp.]|uniref:glycosyltransferase family 4 protein n=1 Tax=Methylovirgula sp. TaxID=1978224 RepID=UPI00307629DE
MTRAIAFDVTHLTHRVHYPAPAGIEKVDMAYARYFSDNPGALTAAVHYGLGEPVLFGPGHVGKIVAAIGGRWQENLPVEDDEKYQRIRSWLLGLTNVLPREKKRETIRLSLTANGLSLLRMAKQSLLRDRAQSLPEGAIYLNIAQHGLEFDLFFEWLTRRRDLQKVFFIHDLLPLDHPEFWPSGHKAIFQKRIDCALKHGTGFLTSSFSVRNRLQKELSLHGRRHVPIFAHPLLPTLNALGTPDLSDGDLRDIPYFLMIATIEPRKNHLLILNIWRELAARGGAVPKLILVGKRGWMNEHILHVLDQASTLSAHVAEVSGLGNAALKKLIVNARAVLMPSHAEGFGLPVVDALSAGTPVVASDIPALREASNGNAIFRHPIDAAGWLSAIEQLSDSANAFAGDARAGAAAFQTTSAPEYFAEVKSFLYALNRT